MEEKKVCVIGIWHLGSVTAGCLADLGYNVVGFDRDAGRVQNLNEGVPPLFEPGLEDLLDKNSYDLCLGLEYDITDMITVSAGYMKSSVGLTDAYQSDMSFDFNSDSFGFGGRLRLNPNFDVDLGVLIVSYKDYSKQIPYPALGPTAAYRELYQQTAIVFSVGAGYHFGGQVSE